MPPAAGGSKAGAPAGSARSPKHVGPGRGNYKVELRKVEEGQGSFVLCCPDPTRKLTSDVYYKAAYAVIIAVLVVVLGSLVYSKTHTSSAASAQPGGDREVHQAWRGEGRPERVTFLAGLDLASLATLAAKKDSRELPGNQQVFDIVLDHAAGKQYGFDCTYEYNSLYVNGLTGGGVVGDWNARYPERALRVGDRIVAVGDEAARSEALRAMIGSPTQHTLRVLRVPPGVFTAARPVQYYSIILERDAREEMGALLIPSGESVLIQGIEDGVLQRWNEENPDLMVRPGDRIMRVNKVRGNAMRLLSECKRSRILEIELLEGAGDVQTKIRGLPNPTTEATTTPPATTTTPTTTPAPTTTTLPATTTTALLASTRPPAPWEAPPPSPVAGPYVRGLRADFWFNIKRDLNVAAPTAVIDRTAFFTMMKSRPPDHTRLDKQVYYPLTTMGWGGDLPVADNFAARWTGQLLIKEGGDYSFSMKSDDSSAMIIDGQFVVGRHAVPDWQLHEWAAEPTESVTLSSGAHALEIVYLNTFHLAGLTIRYAGPDTEESMVNLPATALRVKVSDLPQAALHDGSFLTKFGRGPAGQPSPAATGGHGAAAAARAEMVLAMLLSCAAVSGVVWWVATRRGRRRRAAAESLRRILETEPGETEPCFS